AARVALALVERRAAQAGALGDVAARRGTGRRAGARRAARSGGAGIARARGRSARGRQRAAAARGRAGRGRRRRGGAAADEPIPVLPLLEPEDWANAAPDSARSAAAVAAVRVFNIMREISFEGG